MKTSHLILSLALACTVQVGHSARKAVDWRPTVDSLMVEGEFARANAVMKKLPARQRKQQAVTIDSLQQIMQRIQSDFSLSPQEGKKLILEKYPQATDEQIENWKHTRALEVRNIDGQERWFRKSVRNLWLLAPEFAEKNAQDASDEAQIRASYARRAMGTPADANNVRDWHRCTITFSLDVNADAVPAGETLRVWMPFPFANMRQRNIELIASNRPVTHSQGSQHHTVYMEAQAVKGEKTHFEYTFAYDVAERHIAQQDLLMLVQPYVHDDNYVRYTSSEGQHIVVDDAMRELALDIVGRPDVNPVIAANRIYHWIAQRYPWAGALEYSTIPNIPRYVIENGHGDCGQVTLLYITLCRAYGIPARWESGWMLHPGEKNLHDWGETYFEGVGWVPTDMSFGRSAESSAIHDYYATGIDVYRLATNEGVGQQLSPAKQYIRCETIDFQVGEVEWRGGNLWYDKWDSHLNIDSFEPIGK